MGNCCSNHTVDSSGDIQALDHSAALSNRFTTKQLALLIKVQANNNAAIGIASRRGLGKVRHIAVADLWLQAAIREARIAMEKNRGRHWQRSRDEASRARDNR